MADGRDDGDDDDDDDEPLFPEVTNRCTPRAPCKGASFFATSGLFSGGSAAASFSGAVQAAEVELGCWPFSHSRKGVVGVQGAGRRCWLGSGAGAGVAAAPASA